MRIQTAFYFYKRLKKHNFLRLMPSHPEEIRQATNNGYTENIEYKTDFYHLALLDVTCCKYNCI